MLDKLKEHLKKFTFIVALYEWSVEGIRKILYVLMRYIPRRYGKLNQDKTFFLISFEVGNAVGLYSMIMFVMIPFIEFAEKRGWLPVIDLKGTHVSLIQDDDKRETENAWEYYYEQPAKGILLEEVYQSRRVINAWYWKDKIKRIEWNTVFPANADVRENEIYSTALNKEALKEETELKYWSNIVASHIRLNEDMKNKVSTEYDRIFQPNEKILGIYVRAGYRAGAMSNVALFNTHPKQPTCEELIDIVKKKLQEWNCESIFVACDDREYLDKFIFHFGNKCHYMERMRLHYFKNDFPVVVPEEIMIERKGSTVRQCTEEYIVEMYLLSKCNCFYSCIGGGAEFAYLLNGGKFEHVEVYNKGIYEGLGS